MMTFGLADPSTAPRSDGRAQDDPVAVTVVLPTYNEADNLPIVVRDIACALGGIHRYEIIVVDDDSPDRTWSVGADLQRFGLPVRVLRRRSRRGLSSAVVAGMRLARGSTIVVMDADGQHDTTVIPAMVDAISGAADHSAADLCIGSRSAAGGSYGTFGRRRRLLSSVGAEMARFALGVRLSDPMSGFFAVDGSYASSVLPHLNPRGFKILLELVAAGQDPLVTEVGYRFGRREHGETKLSGRVLFDFALAIIELGLGRILDDAVGHRVRLRQLG